jgi:hypothetical protein
MIEDRISRILLLSEKISEELDGIKSESGRLDISETAKESIAENVKEIDAFLERIHVLSNEVIDFSELGNMNLGFHERKMIVLALKRNYGHRNKSALELKISNRTILRKIREHKISQLEYMDEIRPYEGREAISVKYKEEYRKIISYINNKKVFCLKELREFMGVKEYYSTVTHLVDYLRTKGLVSCSERDGREMKYTVSREIKDSDLVFVLGNGVKVASPVLQT